MRRLNPELLLTAYANGYFPMADEATKEIRWYRPNPRAVLPIENFHVSHSLRKTIKRARFRVTRDLAFSEVMCACADRAETWISEDLHRAYNELFKIGYAHSIESWEGERLVGGLYGVALKGAFFGESMFSRETDSSKVALHHLVEHLKARGFVLLEVQFLTTHLASLGAIEITADEYDAQLLKALAVEVDF